MKNFAYIDGSNLENAINKFDWGFDYKRFRIWLKEKYSVDKAIIFLGYLPYFKSKYQILKNFGYEIIFKEVLNSKGKIKGNCDADLVVKAISDAFEDKYDSMILITSDGDFAPLIKFLQSKQKINILISPYKTKKCSILLKRTGIKIVYLNDQKNILQKRKSPQ